MHELARRGTLALGSVALAVAVFYPLACCRVLAQAVAAGGPATRPWTRLVGAMMVDRLTADSGTRAALQFLMATAGRVARLRLVLSAAVGLGLTLVAPLALYWITNGVPHSPSVSLLAAPLVLTIPLVAGWRVVLAMPAELTARWVFRATPMEGFAGRTAARRFIFALGVLVPVALFAPAWIALWGITLAWQFAVILSSPAPFSSRHTCGDLPACRAHDHWRFPIRTCKAAGRSTPSDSSPMLWESPSSRCGRPDVHGHGW